MFSAKSFGALLALVLGSLPIAEARAGVVVASSGPSAGSFKVGRKLSSSDRISLQAGDTVTVLDEHGTRVLKGAGTYTLADKAGADKRATFALLTRQRSAQRMRTGAVRGELTGQQVSNPNLWYVDVTKSATVCLADRADVRLWRPTAEGNSIFALTPAGATTGFKADFREGDMLAGWDVANFPISEGARFLVSGPAGQQANITFRLLDTVPQDAESLASALIAEGCLAQVDQISQAMMASDG